MQEVSGVNAWEDLSIQEQNEFFILKRHFMTYKKPYVQNQRIEVFRHELLILLSFLDKNPRSKSSKSRLIGISFYGPFICMNTKLLNFFINRSKSSINSGLLQFGYKAIKDKVKTKNILINAIPSLASDSSFMRQWTVRCATKDSRFCFLSSTCKGPYDQIEDTDFQQESSQILYEPPAVPIEYDEVDWDSSFF